jgi:hypothetical protein
VLFKFKEGRVAMILIIIKKREASTASHVHTLIMLLNTVSFFILHYLPRAVIVAMAVVDVVEAAVYKVVHVVSVGHHFVSAVVAVVASAGNGLVLIRVFIGDRDFALVPVAVVLMVQVTVMNIVNMVSMSDFGMFAGNVLVRMIIMYVVLL